MSGFSVKGLILRFFAWLFVLFALVYGILFACVDLSMTIPFETVEEAAAARRIQLFYCVPYIVLGAILALVLIVYYLARIKKLKLQDSFGYGLIVAFVGMICTAGTTGIAFYIEEPALVLCIVPAFCLLLYGVYLILKNKKRSVSRH